MLFTTNVTPYKTKAPAIFVEKGDPNGYPGAVSDSKVFVTKTKVSEGFELFRQNFQYHVLATALGTPVLPSQAFSNFLTLPVTSPISSPPIGVSFAKTTPETRQAIQDLGFTEDTHGKTKYFRGSIAQGDEAKVASLNPLPDTWVPVGVADFRGLQAYIISSKVIFGALAAYPPLADMPDQYTSIRDETETFAFDKDGVKLGISFGDGSNESFAYQIKYGRVIPESAGLNIFKRASKVPEGSGIFFPYFPDMLNPDKDFVPDFIIDTFPSLLSPDVARLPTHVSLLRTGWKTLSTTKSGLILSHIAYVLGLALKSGSVPRLIITSNNNYLGTVLQGTDFIAFSKGVQHIPVEKKVWAEEVATFDSHKTGLDELVALFREYAVEDAHPELADIRRSFLNSPRRIHNIMRTISIDGDDSKRFKSALGKLFFKQSFWEPQNPKSVITVFTAIAKGEFLGEDCPIPYKSEAMFTKETTLSCLSVFGFIAPSLFDDKGTVLPIIPDTQLNRQRHGDNGFLITSLKDDKGTLLIPRGQIPCFLRPLKEAVTDFKKMQQSHAISFRTTPRGGVAGTTCVFSHNDSKDVASMLMRHYAPIGKVAKPNTKRKLDLEDPESVKEAQDRLERKQQKRSDMLSFFDTISGNNASSGSGLATGGADADVDMD